jgi:hypothetical protein
MADVRGRFEWEQTASLMALIANIVRDPKKSKPASPDMFNPYAQKVQQITKAPLSILKNVFCK